MKAGAIADLAGTALLVAAASAFGQGIDRAEFSRGLARIIEASKDDFRSLRGNVVRKDEKGDPVTWESSVAIRGTEIVVRQTAVSIQVSRVAQTPEEAKDIHRETVALVRASLPGPGWNGPKDYAMGSKAGRTQFERDRSVDPDRTSVNVIYRLAGKGSVNVSVSNAKRASVPPR